MDTFRIFVRVLSAYLPAEVRAEPLRDVVQLVTEGTGTPAEVARLRKWTDIADCGEWGAVLQRFGNCVVEHWESKADPAPDVLETPLLDRLNEIVAGFGNWVEPGEDRPW